MAVQDFQKNYIFPRIPLNSTLPDDYPDLGRISNISVAPQIKEYHFSRDELEILGFYEITVSYFKKVSLPDHKPAGLKELHCDDFFSSMKIQADGLFGECGEEVLSGRQENTQELYTVQFTRPFHTFIDLEFITRPRSFKPAIIVEKVELNSEDERILKGELVLGLVNRLRRNTW